MSDMKLERGKYYVAEVSFRQGNPVHIVIAYGQLTSGVILWSANYEEAIWTDVSKLSWFKIVTELPQMAWNPSRNMPPSKCEMTQNTEENVRTREEHAFALAQAMQGGNQPSPAMVKFARKELVEAEARGAAKERAKAAEGSLRPMSEAEKNRTPILAKIHDDLFPRVYPERKDLKCWNGCWVVISHTGILADGFDIGWGVAAPVGCGGLTDDWFVGWKPVDRPANVAALEAMVKVLEAENAKLKTAQFYGCDEEEGGSEDISTFFDDHEAGEILEIDGYRLVNTKWVLWDGHFPHVFDTEDEARAALTREGGV